MSRCTLHGYLHCKQISIHGMSTHAKDLDQPQLSLRGSPEWQLCLIIRFSYCFGKKGTNCRRNGLFHFIVSLPTRKLLKNRYNFLIGFVWFDQSKTDLPRDRIPAQATRLYANHATVFLRLWLELTEIVKKKWRKIIGIRRMSALRCSSI